MSSTFFQLVLFLILHPSWLHPWQWTHSSHFDNLDQLQFKSLSHSVESLKSVLTRFSTFLSKHSCHDESIWSRRITFLQAHVTFRRKGEWDPPLSPRLDDCFVRTYMKVGTGCRQLQGYVCYIVRNCGLTLVKLKKELSSDGHSTPFSTRLFSRYRSKQLHYLLTLIILKQNNHKSCI